MGYKEILKSMFSEVELEAEDLLLLESFQIKYLPDRVPEKEFAVLLHSNPWIIKYFILKAPAIENYINSILFRHPKETDEIALKNSCQDLLWEIAEMIVYNKYPELYDKRSGINWDLAEIADHTSLVGKIIIDAGAGTGKIAFMVAPHAATVYAVEPVTSLRNFIKDKAYKNKVNNLYPLDGFLDSIPLPDDTADILITSNAIGWNIEKELNEIERILKPGGLAIHLLHDTSGISGNPLFDILCSPKWNYVFKDFEIEKGSKYKYIKSIE